MKIRDLGWIKGKASLAKWDGRGSLQGIDAYESRKQYLLLCKFGQHLPSIRS